MLPKGTAYTEPTSFDGLAQEQVARLLSHVNGYVRKSIGDRTPWQLFAESFGSECDVLDAPMSFATRDDARTFFHRLTQTMRDWNGTAWDSDDFRAGEAKVREAVASVAP